MTRTPSLSNEARDLLVRLLRNEPRTITGIRRAAPPRIDLAASLTELEQAGYVEIEEEGLSYPNPSSIIRDTLTSGLNVHGKRIGLAAASVETLSETVQRDSESDEAEPRASWARFGKRMLVGCQPFEHSAGIQFCDAQYASGSEVRLVRQLPSWLADHRSNRAALEALGLSGTAAEALPRDGGIPEAEICRAAFEECWAKATPYLGNPRDMDLVLGLCGQGMEDAEIGAILALPSRGVRRLVAAAMNQLGARTRFELGARWVADTHAAAVTRSTVSEPNPLEGAH